MKRTFSVVALCASLFAMTGAAQAATIFATQIDAGRAGAAGVGFEATAPGFSTNRADTSNALGAPDQVGNKAGGFYSLGLGGAAVFGFGQSFGGSANLFEVTFGCSGAQTPDGFCKYRESVDIYTFDGAYTPFDTTFVVDDLIALGFSLAESVPNGQANTDAGASVSIDGSFTYLALVDTSPSGPGRDGFDVDSISVSVVPLPASALLLLAGLGAFGIARHVARKR